ncbi:MAG: DUF1102 domain-containing protein [archaeon]
MQRRKFLATVGSLTAASAVGIGTGAFTQMSAARSVDVQVADDAKAYTAIVPHPDSPNAHFANDDGDKLRLDFTDSNSTYFSFGGDGVNKDSVYYFDNVFAIMNRGTQDIYWWLTTQDLPGVYFYGDKSGDADDPSVDILGKENALDTSVGDQKMAVGVKIVEDELGVDSLGELNGSVVINGQATPEYKEWENSQS